MQSWPREANRIISLFEANTQIKDKLQWLQWLQICKCVSRDYQQIINMYQHVARTICTCSDLVPNKLRHLFEELSESAAKGEQLPNIVARNSEQLGTPEVFRSPGEVPRWNSDNSVPCEGEDRSFPIFSYGSYIDHIYIYRYI